MMVTLRYVGPSAYITMRSTTDTYQFINSLAADSSNIATALPAAFRASAAAATFSYVNEHVLGN